MSGPLKLDSDRLRDLAHFLDAVSKATRENCVRIAVHDRTHVEVGDVTLYINWDDEARRYIVDDRIGD